MTANNQVFKDFVRKYKNRRVEFVENVFHCAPDLWQAGVLDSLDTGKTRFAIRSGHGVGKTTLLSWVIIHFMLTRYPQKTAATAPSATQLNDALIPEVKHWVGLLPKALKEQFTIKTDRIELKSAPESSFVTFKTSRRENPEALQGVHSEHVLLLADEASGVDDEVFNAAIGSLSTHGSIFILTGNPTRLEGYFHRIHTTEAGEDYYRRQVSCLDSPRVTPEFLKQIRDLDPYGEEGNLWKVRVLGEFASLDHDKLLSSDSVNSAVDRDIEVDPSWPRVWGLDVSRSGKDKTVLLERQHKVVTNIWGYTGTPDLMALVGWVRERYMNLPLYERPVEICVDAIGLGAGVADRLNELEIPTVSVNVAESSSLNSEGLRLRDNLWVDCRDWFDRKDVSIPNEPKLIGDLLLPGYDFTSSGKRQVDSKAKMRRDFGRSPDYADALVLTFASDAASALWGSESPTSSWNKPIDLPEVTYV